MEATGRTAGAPDALDFTVENVEKVRTLVTQPDGGLPTKGAASLDSLSYVMFVYKPLAHLSASL